MLTNKNNKKVLIFDIQHYCINDGPGIRTVIFFKGCPLKCVWCSNPESQKIYPEIMFFESKCIVCFNCQKVCPENAIVKLKNKRVDRELCTNCGLCTEVCYANALQLSGKYMTVNEIISEIKKDVQFYKSSNGGVTLSGGEPITQAKFAEEILAKCKKAGLHTALETCGHTSWESLKNILKYTNLVLYDLKLIDANLHKKYTGVNNDLILNNLKKIIKNKNDLIIRIPLIPRHSENYKNIKETIKFLKDLYYCGEVHLLPFHNLGKVKYIRLDKSYKLPHLKPPEKRMINFYKNFFEGNGFKVVVGG